MIKISRHQLTLPDGYRWITEDDVFKEFDCFDPRMKKYSLADYYQWSLKTNALVLVREVENKIFGVAYLTVTKDYLMLEMLARNSLEDSQGSGENMLRVIFNVICVKLSISEVRLEAIQGAVFYYDEYLIENLRFKEYDKPYFDEEWGMLTPKKKMVKLELGKETK